MNQTSLRLLFRAPAKSFRSIVIPLIILLIVFPTLSVAQQSAAIQGKITDARTGGALPGANVFIKELEVGAATDRNGNFSFLVSADRVRGQQVTLIARFVGYKQKAEQITLSPGVITKDFGLAEDVLKLEEVVVTGTVAGTFKEKLPFAADRLTKNELEHVPAISAENAIRGKVAGVRIVQGSGQPGTAASVQMRGATSINSAGRSAEPLYIVDGVILGSSIVDIDALNIESIEVVKGPAATSLYGSRAAYGIVNITTARGAHLPENATRISFRNEYGRNQLERKINLSQRHHYKVNANGDWIDKDGNVVDRTKRVPDVVFNNQAFKDKQYKGPLYDQIEEFFNPGFFYTNQLSISHKTQSTNFAVFLTNERTSGIVEGNEGWSAQKVRVNIDHNFLRGLDLSISALHSTGLRDDLPAPNPFFALTFLPPDVNLRAPNSDGTPYIIQPDPTSLEANPLYAVHNAELKDRRKRTLGSLSLRYAPFNWFDLESNLSYDRLDFDEENFYPKGYKTVNASTLNVGSLTESSFNNTAINGGVTASINYNFGDLATRTKLRYLFESEKSKDHFGSGNNFAVIGVPSLNVATEGKDIGSSKTEIRSEGYYFITGLDYQDRYIAEFLIRRDGSSLFGPEERWQTYYRGSAAYRIAKEPWWPFEEVNELKLRYSIGTAGSRPAFAAQYETFSIAAGSVSKATLGNKQLRPEHATEQEVGFELGILDRFLVEFTYAKSVKKDQILQVPLAGYFGYSNRWQNAGTLESNTIEASLKAFIIQTREMSLSATLLFDRTRQRITEFNLPPYRWGTAFWNRKDEEFGTFYGVKWMTSSDELTRYLKGTPLANTADQWQVNDDGYLVPVGAGNSSRDGIAKQLWGTNVIMTGADGKTYTFKWGLPIKFVDDKGSDFQRLGSIVPDFNWSFSTTFRWGGLTAYLLFDAQVGGDIYNNTRQWPMRELNHGEADQFGKSDETKKPVDYYNTLYNVNAVNSHYVEDGSYIKLRELSIRYNLTRADLEPYLGGWINRVTLGVIGRNLKTWTDYTGYDPEVGRGNAAVERFDGFTYPNYRNYTVMFEIEF